MAVQCSRTRRPRRKRIGRVSYYFHHGAWSVYYKDGDRQVRRRTGPDEQMAEQTAAQVNAQLATAAPTLFSFTPVTVPELCRRFLDHHEHILRSSLATIRRYRAALKHLEDFATRTDGNAPSHEIQADQFVRFLRSIQVAPMPCGFPRCLHGGQKQRDKHDKVTTSNSARLKPAFSLRAFIAG
jgi:integrase